MSVQSFGYTLIDANVKSLNSFGSIGAQGNIILNAFDGTQPDGKAAGNTGKNAFIALGNNTSNNPLYIVGQDSQLTAGQPNRGKMSIVPNVGAPNHQYDGHETMGIGYDSTNKTNPMPAGAWIRSAAGVDGFNACFSLSNVDNTQSGAGTWYTHALTRAGQPNANDYDLYLNKDGAVSQNILKIHPTSPTTTDFTITATNIFLDGHVNFNNNPAVGTAIMAAGALSVDVSGGAGLANVTATSIILLTQASANTASPTAVAVPFYVVAGTGHFTIHTDDTLLVPITINWFIAKY